MSNRYLQGKRKKAIKNSQRKFLALVMELLPYPHTCFLAFNCTTSLIHSTPKQNSIINKHIYINKHLQDFFIFSMVKTLRTPSSCDIDHVDKIGSSSSKNVSKIFYCCFTIYSPLINQKKRAWFSSDRGASSSSWMWNCQW